MDEPESDRPEENEMQEPMAETGEVETQEEAGDPLAEAEAAVARLKDQLLRTAADFDNFRKRAKRDIEDAGRRARVDVLLKVLPIVDNLERAVHAAHDATDVDAVVQGVEMVLKSFDDIAEGLELERVKTVGERFDPNVHDAIQQMETAEHAPGTILAEVVSGWTLGPKLLRPAMVVVAKAPTAES